MNLKIEKFSMKKFNEAMLSAEEADNILYEQLRSKALGRAKKIEGWVIEKLREVGVSTDISDKNAAAYLRENVRVQHIEPDDVHLSLNGKLLGVLRLGGTQ